MVRTRQDLRRVAAQGSLGPRAQADDGATLWVTIDGIKYTYAEGAAYGGTNTEEGRAWAARVMGVVCQSVQNAGQARAPIVRGLLSPALDGVTCCRGPMLMTERHRAGTCSEIRRTMAAAAFQVFIPFAVSKEEFRAPNLALGADDWC